MRPLQYLEGWKSPTGKEEFLEHYPASHPNYVMFAPESVNMFVLSQYWNEFKRLPKNNKDFACQKHQLLNRVPGSYVFCYKSHIYNLFSKHLQHLRDNHLTNCLQSEYFLDGEGVEFVPVSYALDNE